MILLGHDPGISNASALIDTSHPFIQRSLGQYSFWTPPIFALDLYTVHVDRIITELQWLKGSAKNRDGILTLAFDAGITLCKMCGQFQAPGYALPVPIWKSMIFNGANTNRRVHWNQIRKVLTAAEIVMLPKGARVNDALSAIGIVFAAFLLGDRLEGYRRC